ncbi:neuropilin and tolloid-like protein 2 [Limulus polyphemus]|uniref:Neuropilin and tolloid-like protein 2 n=1 Tax=Limulus polyphemus TaxID=6850 RepID=A0ABM1SQF2_LIMPO|nr:neuropilin and tolloid-like protein 2 [Limulus polyphemus]
MHLDTTMQLRGALFITYSFILIQLTDGCMYHFDSTQSKVGNFSSPNFPAKYPDNLQCNYQFVGKPYETLRLTFFSFELEQPYKDGCLTDYVDISTVTAFKVKQLVGRFCGRDVTSPIQSMYPQMEIMFRTNHAKQFRGFYGKYDFRAEKDVPPPESSPKVKGCGGIETGFGGVIISPGYPDSFPEDVKCIWLIRVAHGMHIYIRVLELQLYGSIANCADAELSVFDGYSSFEFNPDLVKRYCGDLKYYKNVEEKTALSERNRLLIRFLTSRGQGKIGDEIMGFKLMWTAVTFRKEGECEGFTCKTSQFCVNSGSPMCAQTRQYCIDPSLVCNGLPNCSENDVSDEDQCNIPLLAGCGAAVSLVVLCSVVGIIVYRKRRRVGKSMSQTQNLNMQLRQLECSPSFPNRSSGNYYSSPSEVCSPLETNCRLHPHYDVIVTDNYPNYRTDV